MEANAHVVSILLLTLITLSLGVIVYGVVGEVLREPETPTIEPLPRVLSAKGVYYLSEEGYTVEINVDVSECPSLSDLSALLLGNNGNTWEPIAIGSVRDCKDRTAVTMFRVRDLSYDQFRVHLIKMGARTNGVDVTLIYAEPSSGSEGG